MIKLNTTQQTFEKYLYSYGYNYKIKQFSDFISSIQRLVFNKIKETSNLEVICNEIFPTNPNINVFFDKKNINVINKNFLISLVEDSQLDLYFEEKAERFSQKQMEYAYFLSLLKKQKIFETDELFQKKLNRKDIVAIKGRKCFDKNQINLSKSSKERVGISTYADFLTIVFPSFTNTKGNESAFKNDFNTIYNFLGETYSLNHHDTTNLIIKSLSEKSFIFENKNKFQIHNFGKISRIIKDLEEFYTYESIVEAIKVIHDKKYEKYEYQLMDMRETLSQKYTRFNESENQKINNYLLRLAAFDFRELSQLEFTFRNNSNELTIPIFNINDK